MAAGAAAAAAAAAKQQRDDEEEQMTPYTREEIDNDWEFKIVRSQASPFSKPATFQKLIEEEAKLIEQRKNEIGKIAERCNMFTVSDSFLAGLFLYAQDAINNASPLVKEWQVKGELFLKIKREKAIARETKTKDEIPA